MKSSGNEDPTVVSGGAEAGQQVRRSNKSSHLFLEDSRNASDCQVQSQSERDTKLKERVQPTVTCPNGYTLSEDGSCHKPWPRYQYSATLKERTEPPKLNSQQIEMCSDCLYATNRYIPFCILYNTAGPDYHCPDFYER